MEKRVASLQPVVLYGAGKRSRTPDLRITNALLYQLSYAGLWVARAFNAPEKAAIIRVSLGLAKRGGV